MRIKLKAPIDRDAASPDSIEAANTYLTHSLFERAESMKMSLDWTKFGSRVRRRLNGDLEVIQWATVIEK